jgi:hypothetical protein
VEVLTIVILSKPRFCQHGRRQKIGVSNFWRHLHHSARVRKQKTSKIFCFVTKTDRNAVFNPVPLGNLTFKIGLHYEIVVTAYITNYACDVTLSVYPHRASLKNMPDNGGNLTYDLWNTSPM